MLRVGQGIDVHSFEAGRPLILGGVVVPHSLGLAGHSDADALVHAIIDAILGAVGRGDIGQWFPDTDVRWKDADSCDLLSTVWTNIAEEGWRLGNLDATIVTEMPRLAEFLPIMGQRLAGLLGVDLEQINIKATTSERMGALGRGEGLLAMAIVLLER